MFVFIFGFHILVTFWPLCGLGFIHSQTKRTRFQNDSKIFWFVWLEWKLEIRSDRKKNLWPNGEWKQMGHLGLIPPQYLYLSNGSSIDDLEVWVKNEMHSVCDACCLFKVLNSGFSMVFRNLRLILPVLKSTHQSWHRALQFCVVV